MKLTTATLKRIIKEEMKKVLNEDVMVGELASLFMNTYAKTLYGTPGADARLTFEGFQLINGRGIRASRGMKAASGADAQEQNFHGIVVDLMFDQPIQKSGKSYEMLYDKSYRKRYPDFSKMKMDIAVTVKEVNIPDQDVRDHGLQQGQIATKVVNLKMTSGEFEFEANANYDNSNPDASKPQATEEAKVLAGKVLKFLAAMKKNYEGQTDDSKIPTRQQVVQLASKIFGMPFKEE